MDTCAHCGESFKKLSLHWYHKPDHRSNFSKEDEEIITGILMGDGYIDRGDGEINPKLFVEMVTKEYLDWLDNKLGVMSCGVSLSRTAEENSKRGVFGDSSSDFQDTYKLNTRRHPQIKKFADWYSSGEKVFPDKVSLTPTVLKHWYVCDGYYRNTEYHNSIEIGLSNESENRDKINNYFSEVGLPKPAWDDHGNAVKIRFTNEESEELFNYMDNAVVGFSYKFPDTM